MRLKALAGVLAFSFSCAMYGQVSAILSGTVTDQSGAAISGAAVTVKSVDTGASRSATTDTGGHYEFSALPVGL